MGTFGSRLKEFRQLKRLSQELFAARFNASQANLTQWERDISLPSSNKMNEIQKAFKDLNIDWLLNGTGPMLLKDGNSDEIEKLMAILKEKEKENERLKEELLELHRELRQQKK